MSDEQMLETEESVGPSEESYVESSEQEVPSLPELTDEQLQQIITTRNDLKIPVKIDGREEMLPINEFRNRMSHQAAVSRRMNELVKQEKELSAAREEFKYLLKTDPVKLSGILGVPLSTLTGKPQALVQKAQPKSEAYNELEALRQVINGLQSEVKTLKGDFDSREEIAIKKQIMSEFDSTSQKYPIMQNKELQRFAAFLMSQNSDLSTEEAFKQVSGMIAQKASVETQNILSSKKEAAKKGVIAASSVSSVNKNKKIEEIIDPNARLDAILEKIKLGGY